MAANNRIHLKVKHNQLKAARGKLRPADMARDLGISQQKFASYESGQNRVPAQILIRWCNLLGILPDSVIVEDDRRVLKSLVAATA